MKSIVPSICYLLAKIKTRVVVANNFIIRGTLSLPLAYPDNYSYKIGIRVCTYSRLGHGHDANDDKAIILICVDLFLMSLIYILVTSVYMSGEPNEKFDAR